MAGNKTIKANIVRWIGAKLHEGKLCSAYQSERTKPGYVEAYAYKQRKP